VANAIWQVLILLLVATVVVEGVLLVAVARQVGSISLMVRPHAPRDIGGGPDIGALVDLPDRDWPAVVLFVSPGCPPCEELLPHVPAVQRRYRDVGLVAAVAHPDEGLRTEYMSTLGDVAIDGQALWQEWRVEGTPFAVAIDGDGRVRAGGVVNTIDQLEALAQSALQPPLEEEELTEATAARNGKGAVSEVALALVAGAGTDDDDRREG
jgi:thiol-disulfide isomerase/thioredoxin